MPGAVTNVSSSLRIIVTGLIAQYPLGGVTWDYLQYVLGFARLGHDVYYIEDNDQWPYNPTTDGKTKTCNFNVDYLSEVMARVGLEDRWAYRFAWKSQWFGMSEERRREVLGTADLLVNVSGTVDKLDEYSGVGRLAYIDTDPVFTQVKLARGNKYLRTLVDQHHVLFSFGECLPGAAPDTGDDWIATRQPIVLTEWKTDTRPRDAFTTVMTWVAYKALEFEGRAYGHKDVEFRRFLDLPARVEPTVLEVAANAGRGLKLPRELLIHKGWKLVEPQEVCPDMDGYRKYIQNSRAEWSVAKNGYVEGQSGWFSCRSACYLAAGRPVVVQETGFSRILPVGEGILTFTSLEEAAAAIDEVESNYERHAGAASAVAEACFDSDRVLTDLIDQAMNDRNGPGQGNHRS